METTTDTDALKQRLKQLMVENLMLNVTADAIGDSQALFGPNSLGLDSVAELILLARRFCIDGQRRMVLSGHQ